MAKTERPVMYKRKRHAVLDFKFKCVSVPRYTKYPENKRETLFWQNRRFEQRKRLCAQLCAAGRKADKIGHRLSRRHVCELP